MMIETLMHNVLWFIIHLAEWACQRISIDALHSYVVSRFEWSVLFRFHQRPLLSFSQKKEFKIVQYELKQVLALENSFPFYPRNLVRLHFCVVNYKF